MDELFAPPREAWQRLSPDFARLKRRMVLITWPILLVLAVVPLAIWAPWWVAVVVGAALLAVTVWRHQRQARWAASWGYAERDDELYLTHGLLWRTLTVVPYGRMQAVNITSGPIERSFNLATVQLVTASGASQATIPGLDADAAAALRDRLTERAEARSMGL
ncbi:PH domain-containing protein [Aestuariimicrobium soli]|uniref:PH domain-containing protein n=1 Tax=Aestuariimicrobium soli TaxID=2035834 RepID=UPI003EBE5ABC